MSSILVIGDACRDVFVYCDVTRLCPDVPVPVLNVIEQTENPGMARNVCRNINALGRTCDCLTNKNWHSVTKTRYVHRKSNHTFFRVDSTGCIDKMSLDSIGFNYDVVVISDYDKGFMSQDDIHAICKSHPRVFLDTKKVLGAWADAAFCIKINSLEYEKSLHNISGSMADKIVCTLGDLGCRHRGHVYPVDKVDVQDVSGAGDTFMAGLVVGYMDSGDMEKAIMRANACASEVVRSRGVTVPKGFASQ